jgi:hypothetical protein
VAAGAVALAPGAPGAGLWRAVSAAAHSAFYGCHFLSERKHSVSAWSLTRTSTSSSGIMATPLAQSV